jgi:hypothetical protein
MFDFKANSAQTWYKTYIGFNGNENYNSKSTFLFRRLLVVVEVGNSEEIFQRYLLK